MQEYEKFYKRIDDNFDAHIKAVQALIRQRSISNVDPGQGQDVFDCAEMLRKMIADLGAEKAEAVDFGQGFPVVFGRLNSKNPNAKTIIVYSLYDVQPAEEDNWITPPFEAAIVDAEKIDLPRHLGKCIVGRGAKNQKGPTMGCLNAIKTMLSVTGDVPVNILFVFDGEEERGSGNLCGPFRKQYLEELKKADAAYYLNPSQDVKGDHIIFLSTRGLCPLELTLVGGSWGGSSKPLGARDDLWIDSPVMRLMWALCSLKAQDGRVLMDRFYDAVAPLSGEIKELIDILAKDLDEAEMYRELGVKRFKEGKSPKELLSRYIAEPTINIDGILAGYTGPGIKTNFPNKATVKMDFRLVPNQNVDDLLAGLRNHLDKHGFSEVKVSILSKYNPSKITSPKEPIVKAAVKATELLGVRPLLWPIYFGGVPTSIFSDPPLNVPVIIGGLGVMGRDHMANEYFTVEGLRNFEKYVVTFFHEFAKL